MTKLQNQATLESHLRFKFKYIFGSFPFPPLLVSQTEFDAKSIKFKEFKNSLVTHKRYKIISIKWERNKKSGTGQQQQNIHMTAIISQLEIGKVNRLELIGFTKQIPPMLPGKCTCLVANIKQCSTVGRKIIKMLFF